MSEQQSVQAPALSRFVTQGGTTVEFTQTTQGEAIAIQAPKTPAQGTGETITVTCGELKLVVDTANGQIAVTGQTALTLQNGACGLSLGADGSAALTARQLQLACGEKLALQANELMATAAGGLTLKGAEVQVNAGGKLLLQGAETHLNGMATTEVAASGFLKLQGTLVQLN